MQSITIVRLSDMKPVAEFWSHELHGRALKREFMAVDSVTWLQRFNRAVELAGGAQPSPALIRAQF